MLLETLKYYSLDKLDISSGIAFNLFLNADNLVKFLRFLVVGIFYKLFPYIHKPYKLIIF